MAWDFETDAEFQKELDWISDFVSSEVEPLDFLLGSPYDVQNPRNQDLVRPLQEEVKRLSVTDELTGLYNRRYFNQNLPEEIKIGEKWSSSLSLIMMDIDDFKTFNDTYHHLKGDEIIKATADVIAENIRLNKDWACRFGGGGRARLPGEGRTTGL